MIVDSNKQVKNFSIMIHQLEHFSWNELSHGVPPDRLWTKNKLSFYIGASPGALFL